MWKMVRLIGVRGWEVAVVLLVAACAFAGDPPADQSHGQKTGPTPAEKRSAAEAECVRGSRLMADYWGGIVEAVLEWDIEYYRAWEAYNRDFEARTRAMRDFLQHRIVSNPDPASFFAADEGASKEQFTRAKSVVSAARSADAVTGFLDSPNEGGELPQAFEDAVQAITALAVERAEACSKRFDAFEHATGDFSAFDSLYQAEKDAMSRFSEACRSLVEWAWKQEWMRRDAFLERLSPPLLAVNFLPRLKSVLPDPVLKSGCVVGVMLKRYGALKTADRITGVRRVSENRFEPVETWRDLRSKLVSYRDKPATVCVRVAGEGGERTETVAVEWPKL